MPVDFKAFNAFFPLAPVKEILVCSSSPYTASINWATVSLMFLLVNTKEERNDFWKKESSMKTDSPNNCNLVSLYLQSSSCLLYP